MALWITITLSCAAAPPTWALTLPFLCAAAAPPSWAVTLPFAALPRWALTLPFPCAALPRLKQASPWKWNGAWEAALFHFFCKPFVTRLWPHVTLNKPCVTLWYKRCHHAIVPLCHYAIVPLCQCCLTHRRRAPGTATLSMHHILSMLGPYLSCHSAIATP
jgi:hypothetical protein